MSEDTGPACQECMGPVGESPSRWFCGQGCQERWHARLGLSDVPEPEPYGQHDAMADRVQGRGEIVRVDGKNGNHVAIRHSLADDGSLQVLTTGNGMTLTPEQWHELAGQVSRALRNRATGGWGDE